MVGDQPLLVRMAQPARHVTLSVESRPVIQ
jgi:hypothetical protein